MKTELPPQLFEKVRRELGLEQPLHYLGRLEGGTLNRLYLLQCGEQQLVVKQGLPNQPCGSSWSEEYRLQRIAAELELAPRLLLQDTACKLMVMEHAGQPITSPVSDGLVQQAGRLLRTLHSSPCHLETRTYGDLLEQLLEQATIKGLDLSRLDLAAGRQIAAVWDKQPGCWCHHDLSPGNVLVKEGKPCLIDWEYSGRGNPAFDLACLANSWKLGQNQLSLLLGTHNMGVDGEALQLAGKLVKLFDQLWYSLYQPGRDNAPHQ